MCDAEYKFWLKLGVESLTAIATFAAVLVALFGDIVRSKWFPPLLNLSLLKNEGEKCPVTIRTVDARSQSITEHTEKGRFYHLRVSNSRRWSPALNTKICLTKITLPGPGGNFQETWHGEVPMRWRHQEIYGSTRTIGHAAECDLCSVIKGGHLEILVSFIPNDLAKFLKWQSSVNLIATFVAISDRADSRPLEVKISWDGKWEDGDNEMGTHVVIK